MKPNRLVSRVLLFVLALTLIGGTVATAEVGIETEGPCYLYGIHRMVSQGPAFVSDCEEPYDQLFFGGWYQCNCGERFVCEGYPEINGPIGDYITEGAIVSWEAAHGVYNFYADPNLVYHTEVSSIEGYSFYSHGK